MGGDEQVSFVTRLTERGLTVHSFDGHTLRLTYNAAADHEIEEGRAISGDELTQYAQRVLADPKMPGDA